MKQHQMTKRVTTLSVLASLSLLAACSSDSEKAVGSGGAASMGGAPGTGGAASICKVSDAGDGSDAGPTCVSRDGVIICADKLCKFPFVTTAFDGSDYCAPFPDDVNECPVSGTAPPGESAAILRQTDAGTLCLSGTVSPGGYVTFGLELSTMSANHKEVVEAFNADALGITQVAFTIDSPPSVGVTVGAEIITSFSCPASFFDCIDFGFELMTAPGSSTPVVITQPGRFIAPFANFKQTLGGSQKFDTSKLNTIGFGIVDHPGDFNFCIHDFQLLDAQGNEVKP